MQLKCMLRGILLSPLYLEESVLISSDVGIYVKLGRINPTLMKWDWR